MEGKDLLSNTGAIASTIDLLAHEYGWSVETILALTMNQLRRTIRAIRYRKKMKADAWKDARVSEASGDDVAASMSKRGQTFDLDSDFESALYQSKKMGLAIKDR